MTISVSPDATTRSPGDEKSAAENNMPEVPEDTLHRKAPPTVAVAFMTYEAGDIAVVATDGLASVAGANMAGGRVPL